MRVVTLVRNSFLARSAIAAHSRMLSPRVVAAFQQTGWSRSSRSRPGGLAVPVYSTQKIRVTATSIRPVSIFKAPAGVSSVTFITDFPAGRPGDATARDRPRISSLSQRIRSLHAVEGGSGDIAVLSQRRNNLNEANHPSRMLRGLRLWGRGDVEWVYSAIQPTHGE